ncbi:unnamed protein product [Aspergillus oryzae]|nr:unnamed protein product [Aspergillus oryzae]
MYSMVLDVNWMLVSPYQWVFGTKPVKDWGIPRTRVDLSNATSSTWSRVHIDTDDDRIGQLDDVARCNADVQCRTGNAYADPQSVKVPQTFLRCMGHNLMPGLCPTAVRAGLATR